MPGSRTYRAGTFWWEKGLDHRKVQKPARTKRENRAKYRQGLERCAARQEGIKEGCMSVLQPHNILTKKMSVNFGLRMTRRIKKV